MDCASPYEDEPTLARACQEGELAAIAWLEERYLYRVAEYVRHLRVDTAEVLSAVRDHLLPPPLGCRNRIAQFTGNSPLTGWIRVVSVRIALDLRRKKNATKRRADHGWTPISDDIAHPGRDPLADVLRARYRPLLSACLSESLRALSVRERVLLRIHFIDGASLEGIGQAYGKNRSTIFRWLEKARQKVLAASADRLRRQLALSSTDLRSLVHQMESQLSFDLHDLLGK